MIMEREIKFRGKDRRTGEWVYGFYCRHDYGAHYQDKKLIKEACSVYDIWTTDGWVAVEETSLGQFTGLTDCNGKEIYEGDIVKVTQIRPKHLAPIDRGTCVVSFSPWYGWSVGTDMIRYEVEARTKLGAIDKIEIIGNVFDNPNLIPNQPTAI